ncbi:MAG: decarboxylating NADP(+)-dependent phosphogluconate dehydrogenase, partial [Acidobacteriota bacterium]|nr:decarboxylating NADP(+)-dependent phosphogluconate dehydrogenase [Acidobacteriota bacterium]
GIHFVGSGVSGGEVGARFGPSLMPGGSRDAWRILRPIWNAVAARVDRKTGRPIEGALPGKPVRGGEPCTTYIGSGGAGHYVKMVHNGIEYGDMQLICEAYFLLSELLGLRPPDVAEIFTKWNRGDLDSFLMEISAEILGQRDPDHPRRWIVDAIRDTAGQKGTGRWTSINALDLGVPAATIAEAVFARTLSARQEERGVASKKLRGPRKKYAASEKQLIDSVRDALYCSKVCSYAQGFSLMSEARREYGFKLNLAKIAKIWRGGCIIRAGFLQKIADAYTSDRKLPNLLLDPYFRRKLHGRQDGWRKTVAIAAQHGVSTPAFMSALAYFDGYRSKRLPANLLQGQRDFFGAHGFERLDRPQGQFFHIDWPDPKRPQRRVR